MIERHKIVPSVYLILEKNQTYLFGLRQNTGYYDEHWGLIAGHVEKNESATSAMIREVDEEIGLKLTPDDLYVIAVIHRLSIDRENVEFFFKATYKGQNFINKEPAKCQDLRFFALDNLPANTIPFQKQAIKEALNGVHYLELGWNPEQLAMR